jgi:HSP20 family protein
MLPALHTGSQTTNAGSPVNRLLDHFFRDDFAPPALATNWLGANWTGLPLSVWQDDANVYVEADMPGLKSDEIEISIEQRTLMIGGERKRAERSGDGYDNRLYGRFEQKVMLPIEVQSDQVEAQFDSGVLKLKLPKSEAAKPRKIAVRTDRS